MLILLAGCATFGGLQRERMDDLGGRAWELPPGAYPSQRLYRMHYEGPEGELDLKLVLKLEAPGRYRLNAVHGLGRKLWDLAIGEDGRALWVDHREETYCHAGDAGSLVIVPIARLPLASLPNLLLGRLPNPPASELESEAGRLAYRDALGQLWNGGLAETGADPAAEDQSFGELAWWTLIEDGEPVAWWRRQERGGVFSDRRGRQQLAWEEVVAEPLVLPLTVLAAPAGYRETACLPGGTVPGG